MGLTPQEELELLNTEIAIKEKEQAEPQNNAKAELKLLSDTAMNAVPGLKAAMALGNANPTVRRAITTGVGEEVGRLAGPVGSAAGAVTGSLAADAADNPETAMKVMGTALKSAIPGMQVQAAKETVDLVKDIDPVKAKEAIIDKAVLAGTAATMAKITGKAVKAVKGTDSPASIAFQEPKLAFDKARKKVLAEFTRLKKNFIRVDEGGHIADMTAKVATPGQAVEFVADGYRRIKDGSTAFTNTELIFLREASRKASKAKGGNISVVAGEVFRNVDRELKKRSPELWAKYKKAERAIKIAGDEKPFGLLEIATAVKAPFLTAASQATGRAAGVAGRGLTESVPAAAALMADQLNKLRNRRKK